MPHPNFKKLLSQKQVANLIGVSENTIKNWRARKLLSYFKAPGSRRVLYFEDEIFDFINQNTKSKRGVDTQRKPEKEKNQGKPCVSSDDDWRIS